MAYNKGNIMRRAHALRAETAKEFSECLRMAWAEEKRPKAVAIQPELTLPPLVSAAKGAYQLARKLKGSKIEIAARVHVDFGMRVTPKNEAPIAFVKSKEIAGGFHHTPR